jgi:hypothetical protein
LGQIFPSYKKETVPAPEKPFLSTHRLINAPVTRPHEVGRLLITERRYRLFAASRVALASALRGSGHGRYVIFQMAEVAVPRELFQEILRLIDRLRPRAAPA